MAKYVVSYTGANGVKAYLAGKGEKLYFTFAIEESYIFTDWKYAYGVAFLRKEVSTYFLHDPNVATLPAGLDWQIEEITE